LTTPLDRPTLGGVQDIRNLVQSAGRRRTPSVLLAAALAVAAGALGQGEASGSTNVDLQGLRHAACPPPLRPLSPHPYSDDAVRDARTRHLFKVGPHSEQLVRPVDWLQDPHRSQRFRNALASLSWVDALLYDYRHRQHSGSLRQARNLMLDWVHHQPRHGAHTSRDAWHSKVVGDRAGYLGYMTRAAACEHLLRHDQALAAIRSLKVHAHWLLRHHSKTNHGLFDNLGLLALGRDLRFTENARQWRRLGRTRFVRFFHRRVMVDEGFWLENSAAYHYLLTHLLERFVPAARGHRPGLPKLLSRMRTVGGWLIEPDHRIVQFGDSNLSTPGPHLQRRSDADRGMLTLLKSGLAVVKQPGSFLSVVADFHNAAHKHSDELSFDLFDHGHRIVSDTGMYHKDPGRLRHFVKSARAHSTLTVDGRNFPRSGSFTYGSGLQARGAGSGWYAIQGKNPLLSGQGVRHFRLFLYKPGTALIIVDRVRSSRTHTYDRYFQLGPDIDINGQGPQTLDLQAPGLTGTLYSESSTGPEKRTSRRGNRRPLSGWTSPSYRTFVPRWTVDLRSVAGDADYATTISLDSGDLRAGLGSTGPNRTTLSLRSEGAGAGTLTVQRNESKLVVVQNP
jgi:hypothetical protein